MCGVGTQASRRGRGSADHLPWAGGVGWTELLSVLHLFPQTRCAFRKAVPSPPCSLFPPHSGVVRFLIKWPGVCLGGYREKMIENTSP